MQSYCDVTPVYAKGEHRLTAQGYREKLSRHCGLVAVKWGGAKKDIVRCWGKSRSREPRNDEKHRKETESSRSKRK